MPNLSSILVQRGIASMRAVEDAIARQVFHGGDLPTNLLEVGAVREEALTPILAEIAGLPAAPAGRLPAPSARVLRLVPAELAEKYGIFPLDLHERSLLVATAEPLSPAIEDDLGFALDLAIEQVAAPIVRIVQAIAEHYGIPAERRVLRIVARLDGLSDPSPSAMPPPERDMLSMKMPRTISVPSPSFGTGVPSSEPEPARLYDELPAAKTPFVAAHDFVNPSIPRSPALPAGLHDGEPESAPPAPAPAPVTSRDPGAARALAGLVKKAIRDERRSTIDKTNREARPVWRSASRRKGPFTLTLAEREMEEATASEAVVEIVFAFAQQFFEYTALFVVQGDRAEGRDAIGPGAARADVAGLAVPLDLPGAIARVRGRRAPWIGRLAEDGVDADLARALGRTTPRVVAILPIVVRTRVVALLYGDDGDAEPELASLGDVLSMIGLAGAALERIALRKKLGARAPEFTLKVRVQELASNRPPALPKASVTALAAVVAPAAETRSEPPPEIEVGPADEIDDDITTAFDDEPTVIRDDPTVSFDDEATVAADLAEAAAAADDEAALEAEFEVSPPDDDDVLPSSRAPRTARYFDEPPTAAAQTVASLRQTNPGIGGIPFPDAARVRPYDLPLAMDDVSDDASEAATIPRFEAVHIERPPPAPSPGKRGPAPIYEGRATTRSAPPIGFEPLPHVPPPNATAWQSFPSAPPPESLLGRRQRSERPIPREDDDAPSRHGRADHVALPSVVVDVGAEYQSLVQRVIDGGASGQRAYDELLRSGDHAAPAVMARFPGPLRVDRHRARGELPAASQCGPILELTVAFRRAALPFVSGRISSPDPEVRFWSAHVLGELRYPEAATALLPRLFDDDASVRRVARRSAAALVGAGAAGLPVLKGLEDIVKNREEPVPNRVLAIETMGEIRAASMVSPLVAALSEPSDEIVDGARRALLVIARQDFGRDQRDWQAWWADNGSRHRIEWLIDALMHEQPSLRRAAGDELKVITKEYFGYYDDLPKRERERAQALYRAWWDREGKVRFG